MVIRRRPLFYTINLLLPSIFLMVMDIVGFYLPPNSGERVSFKITLLLGYSVFLIIVSDTLPATAVGTPLIGEAASLVLGQELFTQEQEMGDVGWYRNGGCKIAQDLEVSRLLYASDRAALELRCWSRCMAVQAMPQQPREQNDILPTGWGELQSSCRPGAPRAVALCCDQRSAAGLGRKNSLKTCLHCASI